ncbi:E3 ubiquitin-protein ligase RAD18-like [Palaemon carinicauda]|uniref:E3 ubiquitin-protein ligase RAD18-like n=1 Tax=Palaemon carinicauda TaxID=392227 RepID=UPI0035B611F9
MAVETSLPWPSNIPELKRLDELLRCGICYELMSTSMVTVCSHNFCSICIRQYLGYKTQCPACFQETTGQQLRNNRLLDEIIGLFPGLRDKTARHCQSIKGNTISAYLLKDEDSNDSNGPASSDVNLMSPDVRNKAKKDVFMTPTQASSCNELLQTPRSTKSPKLGETPKRNLASASSQSPLVSSSPAGNSRPSNSIFNSKLLVRSPSSMTASQSSGTSTSLSQSARQSVSGLFSILGERAGSDTATEDPKVACPVCNVHVPERNINLHLDACLKRMEEESKEAVVRISQTPKRKPLPKLVYSLLSDKQLRQMLKEVGLPINGDKQQLSNRHRRYTTLYNVECDAAEPRPVQELLRQVEREEKEEARGTTKSIFSYDRKTPVEVIEKEQVNYLKKNDNHFAKLIADIKKRQEAKKKKLKEVVEDHSEEEIAIPSTSKAKAKSSSRSKANSMHHISSSDDDSDSESSKGKTSFGTEKKNSIMNFFQNSPRKSSQSVSEKPSTSNRVDESISDNLITNEDDDLFSEEFLITNGSNFSPSESSDVPLVKSGESTGSCDVPSVNNGGSTESGDVPVMKSGVSTERCDVPVVKSGDSIDELKVNGYAADFKPESDVTNFFNRSPAHSDSSDDSLSLLQDQESQVLQDQESQVLQDQESQEEPMLFSGTSVKGEAEYDSEEELIPGRQPESCPVELQPDHPPSPSIGKRVTRKSKSLSQPQKQDLSHLGPETQDLELDSQNDPEYQPSQMLDDLESEESVPMTRKSKRNPRKRQGIHEPSEVPRNRRRRK